MKKSIVKLLGAVMLLITFSYGLNAQTQNTQGYKELRGRFKNNSANTILCPCNTQGLFRYYFNEKEELLTLCFDKLQGNLYQIYNDEIITIEGTYVSKTCSNGGKYLVFEVEQLYFDDNSLQRQLIATNPIVKPKPAAVKPIPKTNNNKVSFTGDFQSKQGVMSPISCYGYNIGYLSPSQNGVSEVIVCFDKMPNGENINVNCKGQIYVEGYYENKTISNNGSCPSGTKKIFYVTKWYCK